MEKTWAEDLFMEWGSSSQEQEIIQTEAILFLNDRTFVGMNKFITSCVWRVFIQMNSFPIRAGVFDA